MPHFCLSDGDHRLPLALAPLHCLQFQDNSTWDSGSQSGKCSTATLYYFHIVIPFSHYSFFYSFPRVLLIVSSPFASDRALKKGDMEFSVDIVEI